MAKRQIDTRMRQNGRLKRQTGRCQNVKLTQSLKRQIDANFLKTSNRRDPSCKTGALYVSLITQGLLDRTNARNAASLKTWLCSCS